MRQRPSAYIYPLVYPCILSPPPRHTHPFLQFIYADALHDLAVERVKRQRAGATPAELDKLEEALVRCVDEVWMGVDGVWTRCARGLSWTSLRRHGSGVWMGCGRGLMGAGQA